ncbi:MAG TPA: hypothetical protein VKT28_19180 [Puia sp.]|nr:hypothetical protein [Puia sp.]
MQDNRLWFLIARQLSAEISTAETEELHALLQRHPDKQYFFEILHLYFDTRAHENITGKNADIFDEERFRRIIEQNDE